MLGIVQSNAWHSTIEYLAKYNRMLGIVQSNAWHSTIESNGRLKRP